MDRTFNRASSFFALRSRFTLFMASLRLRDRPERPISVSLVELNTLSE